MTAILKPLEIEEISFVDKGASGDAMHRPAVVFWKADQGSHQMDKEQVEAILAAMPEAQRDVMVAALAAAKQEDPPEPDPEEEEKQDDEEEETKQEGVEEEEEEEEKKDAEKAGVAKSKFEKAMAAKDKEIATLKFDKAVADFTKIASEDMGFVPGLAATDLGLILKACSDNLDAKVFGKLKTTLTACSRTIEKGEFFVEIGAPGSAEKSSDKMNRLAKELHDKTPDQTFENCYTKVLKAHPDLYMSMKGEEA